MKSSQLQSVLLVLTLAAALGGAVALWWFNRWSWIPLWFGLCLILLLWQWQGADSAAGALFVLAGLGSLTTAGFHVSQSPFSLAFDPLSLLFALVLLGASVWGLAWRTSHLVYVARGGDRQQSFRYLLKWTFGMATSYQEVREGKVVDLMHKPPKPAKHEQLHAAVAPTMVRPHGHLALQVHPGNAVVYERNGEYAGVLGPGVHFLHLEESVRKVIVTYQRAGSGTLKDLMTKDGIPVTVEYSVSYRIEPRTSPELGKPYPYSEEACMQAAYNAPNWESKIVNGAGGLLADKIAGMTMDELLDLRNSATYPLGELMGKLKTQLQERARRYGAVILGLDIDRLDVPPSVREQMLARWRMHLEAQLRMELSAKALKLVSEHTGQTDPQIALQLLDHVLGLSKLEGLNIADYSDFKRDMERRLIDEMALQEALARPRARPSTTALPANAPIAR